MPDPINIAPGACAAAYQKLAKQYGVNVSPGILGALNKLDANKDPTKSKPLVDAVVTAIVKWDAVWTEEIQKVADPKAKETRAEFAAVMFRVKQAVQGVSGSPSKGPGASEPYKKTTFAEDLLKARKGVSFGAASALADLDEAKTAEEAKPLAAAAVKVIERELTETTANVKDTKDKDRKLKISEYATGLRKMLQAVKEIAK